jgi:alpha-beta hydrolase superfamily lysophospholipase
VSLFGWVLIVLLLLLAGGTAALIWLFSGRMIARRTPDELTSPSDHGLPFEEIAFPAHDAVRLRGWFIPAPQARGTVVFCHGHAGSMDPDVKYAPWFHEAGLNVLMFDFRGHGRSDGDRVSLGTLERQDLLGALDTLAARGIEHVGVLGFSMGGAVAILTAASDERIVAVASDGGFARLDDALIGWARRKGIPHWLARPTTRLVRRVVAWRLGTRLEDPINWIGRISPRPVLLIHGDRDPYVSVEGVEALYAAAGEPKELWRVSEAGHRKVDEHRPAEYQERVVNFFARCFGSS